MTNEEAQSLAKRLWGSDGVVTHLPSLGVRRAFRAGRVGGEPFYGEGCCWEEAFWDAGADPVAIVGRAPEVDVDPQRGRPKTELGYALEVLAARIGVTVQSLRMQLWRKGGSKRG